MSSQKPLTHESGTPAVSSQKPLTHESGTPASPTGSVSSQTYLVPHPSNCQPAPIDAHSQVQLDDLQLAQSDLNTLSGLSGHLDIFKTNTSGVPHPCHVQQPRRAPRKQVNRPAVTGLGKINAASFLVDFGPEISDMVFPIMRNEALSYERGDSFISIQPAHRSSPTNYFVPIVSETIGDSPTSISPAQLLADVVIQPNGLADAMDVPPTTIRDSPTRITPGHLEPKVTTPTSLGPIAASEALTTAIRDSPTTPSETPSARAPSDISSAEGAQAAKLEAEDWSAEEIRRIDEVETVTVGARAENLKRFFKSQDAVEVFDNPPEPPVMHITTPPVKQTEEQNFPSLIPHADNIDFDTQRRLHIERDRQQNVAFQQECSAALWKNQAAAMRREKADEDRRTRLLQQQQQALSRFDLNGCSFPTLGEAAKQSRRVPACIPKPVPPLPSVNVRPVETCDSDDDFENWLTPVVATEPSLQEWMQERWQGGNKSDAVTLLFNMDFPMSWMDVQQFSSPLLNVLVATCFDAVHEANEKQVATKSLASQRQLSDAGMEPDHVVEIAKWLVKTRASLERWPNFNDYGCARALDALYKKLYAKKGKRGNKRRKKVLL